MHPKITSLLKPKALLTTIIAINVVPLIFMWHADKVMNVLLPSLFTLLIPLFFLLYKSSPVTADPPARPFKTVLSIIGMALASLMTLFLIAYFSLSFQPLIAAEGQALWVVLPGAENMAFVIRLFLQTWLFALVCMMAMRWLKNQQHYSGFLLRFYEKKHMLPWLLDFVAIGGVIFLMMTLIILTAQQLSSLFIRIMGFDTVFAFAQVTIFVCLFSMYAFSKSTSFFKRLEHYSKKPTANMPKLLLALMAFIIGTTLFSHAALLGLPDDMQHELAQAINIGIATLDTAARHWPTLVIGCSLFMVAPLSVLFSRTLHTRKSLMLAMIVPVGLASFFLSVFPEINDAFWSWTPTLNFSTVPIDDTIAQMTFNGFSMLLICLTLGLLCTMRNGSLWMRSMVDMSPDTLGRRERRVRENFTKFFKAVCYLWGVFGAFGLYGLGLHASVYVPTILTTLGVLITLSLLQRYKGATASWQVFSKEG